MTFRFDHTGKVTQDIRMGKNENCKSHLTFFMYGVILGLSLGLFLIILWERVL